MSAPPSMPTVSEVALCRSALWEALALGFRAPTDETVGRLASLEGVGALADAAAALDAEGGTDFASCVRRLALTETGDRLAVLERSFRRLFGHTARGAVPPYETEYGEDALFLPAQEMGDLAGFYRAFGLVRNPGAHERIDHVSCECEFLLVLARREAHALERHDLAMVGEIRQAARLFLKDHLGRWASAFGRMVLREDPDGFYGVLGDLCRVFVTDECLRVGLPVGPEFIRLRSASPPDAPMGCAPASASL